MLTKKVVALVSLYEPLEFLEGKIRNLSQCDMSDVMAYFSDCSPEATWEEVDRIVKSSCRFPYKLDHHPQQTTLYRTWNWIIAHTAWAQYYCTSNVDDIIHPDYFQKMSRYLDEYPDKQIVATPWLVTGKPRQLWPPVEFVRNNPPDLGMTCGHFPMWRASLHKEIGLFEPQMVIIGDSQFWQRIRAKYGKDSIGLHPETLGCFLSHRKNLYHVGKGPNGEGGEAWDWQFMSKGE